MNKQSASEASAHFVGQHPEVQQIELVVRSGQCVEADRTTVNKSGVGFVAGDEFGLDSQQVAPTLNPALGIFPVPLGSKRDVSQHRGIVWLRPHDLHGHPINGRGLRRSTLARFCRLVRIRTCDKNRERVRLRRSCADEIPDIVP